MKPRQQELFRVGDIDGIEHDDPTVTTQVVQYNVQNETWFRNVWRPAMAWTYMAICIFDFIVAPVAIATLITFYKSTLPAWTPLTLQGGGLIHVAFGAILGVAAWGRTRERQVEMSPYGPPQPYNNGYGAPPYNGFNNGYPNPPVRTVETTTTIVGNRPPPPRPQRRE